MILPTQDPLLATRHSHQSTIQSALTDCVRLPVKNFALIALLENGDEETYTSRCLAPYQPWIFSDRFRYDFRRYVAGSEAHQTEECMNADLNGDGNRKQSSSEESSSSRSRRYYQRELTSDESDDSTSKKRKRARGVRWRGSLSHDTPIQKTQQLTINNEKDVEQFYYVRFKDMQQSSCKVMGKAFVKLVEPKKQTHYPYTQGDAKAPSWWPAGDNYVRHKEPDHLLRAERIRLLVHILKMIIEPHNKQCPTVQRLGLNVKKLEEVTEEALGNWFHDPEYPENATKKRFLKEIFKVAKVQERYKNGEIDGDTRIAVVYGFDDEVQASVKDEDDEVAFSRIPMKTQISDSLVSQVTSQQTANLASPSMFIPAVHPLPTRNYTQPLEGQSQYQNSSYFRSVSFQSQPADLQDPSRCSFGSPIHTSPPSAYGISGASMPPDSYANFAQQDEHSPFSNSSYLGTASSQDANHRSFGSPAHTRPQSTYGWENAAMINNSTMPSDSYATSPPQDGQFQLPDPATMQHSVTKVNGHAAWRQFESGAAPSNRLRTGYTHQMPHDTVGYANS